MIVLNAAIVESYAASCEVSAALFAVRSLTRLRLVPSRASASLSRSVSCLILSLMASRCWAGVMPASAVAAKPFTGLPAFRLLTVASCLLTSAMNCEVCMTSLSSESFSAEICCIWASVLSSSGFDLSHAPMTSTATSTVNFLMAWFSSRDSLAGIRVIRRGGHATCGLDGRWTMHRRRRDESLDVRGRAPRRELREQEFEFLVERAVERRGGVAAHGPQLLLERPERLLARLVDELFVRVARLPFVGGILPQPSVHLLAEGRRDEVVQHVLETRREMNLGRLDAREVVECAVRERGCAVLHRSREAIRPARFLAKRLKRVEVELHVRDGPVGEHHAAVRRAALDGDLRQARHARRLCGERPVVTVHERAEFLHGGVLGAHLTDLAAERDVDAFRLQRAHVARDVHADLVVQPLLFGQRALRQVDERRRVDVDVVEAGVNVLGREQLHVADFPRGIGGELLCVDLEVIALDEDGSAKPLAQRRGEHPRHVLRGPLVGIRNLGARNLEDERAGIEFDRGAEDRAGGL